MKNRFFYQNLFRKHHIRIEDIRTLADLQKIPTTHKDDLQRENDAFLCVPKTAIVDYALPQALWERPLLLVLPTRI